MPSVVPDGSTLGKSITQKNKKFPYSQFLATLPTNKILVTYFGVFKFGDEGPDCLLHEMFDLQGSVRPQDGRTGRSDPWILHGSHHRSQVHVQHKPTHI